MRRLDIDERAVVLDGTGAGERGGRRYSLLAAPPRLLVGLDGDPTSPDERLVLAGDLSRIAFPEIVSLVATTRLSGVLQVMGSAATRTIAFADGEVRGASSTRSGERLGDVVVRLGHLARDQLEGLLEEAQDVRHAARLAVERGLLTESGLWRSVQEHVTAVFQAILMEPCGAFVLTDARVPDALTLPGLSAEGLLMEGVRRIDEMRVRAGSGGRVSVDEVLAAYDEAFRDIFATAAEAGAGAALYAAARSVLEEDPAHLEVFGELRLGSGGELPVADLAKRLDERARQREGGAEPILSEALSTLTLFLLFVAGEHLPPNVHRALHARVKAAVNRD